MPKSHKSEPKSAAGSPAKPKTVEVTFALEDGQAEEVYLCGDFNGWSAMEIRMVRRNENGRWEKRVELAPGRYHYKFVRDGEWIHDPQARENVHNHHGTLNSVLIVHS